MPINTYDSTRRQVHQVVTPLEHPFEMKANKLEAWATSIWPEAGGASIRFKDPANDDVWRHAMTLVANLRKLCAGPLKVPQSEWVPGQQAQQPSKPATRQHGNPGQEPTIQNSNYVNSNRAAGATTSKPSQPSCLIPPHLATCRLRIAGKAEKAGKSGEKCIGCRQAGNMLLRGRTGCSNIFSVTIRGREDL